MMHFFRFCFLLSCLILLVTSCQKSSTPKNQRPASANVLRLNLQEEPVSLDPRLMRDRNSRTMLKMLFEGLTRVGPDGTPHPAAAEKIAISPDGHTYLFTLRESYWSNGDRVTAYDFEHAWKSALAPDSPSTRVDMFYIIKNARLAKIQQLTPADIGIHALDDVTLKVQLEHPAPYFLDLVANPLFYPVCRRVDRHQPEWHNETDERFVCNGPFRLKSLSHERLIQLTRNPDYWDAAAVKLEGIDITIVKDPHTALLMFEHDELDWIGDPFSSITIDDIPSCKSSGYYHSHPIAGVYWYNLNTKSYPLTNTKLRHALAYSLDRHAIVQLLQQNDATIARTLLSEGMRILSDEELCPDADLTRAQHLLDEALQELNISLEQLPVIKLTYSDVPGQKQMAQAIQNHWSKELGIKVELEGYEWNIFFNQLVNRDFQICGLVFDAAYNDPMYFFEFFKTPESRYNAPQWNNRDYQALISKANYTNDKDLRKHYLHQAEHILMQDMPIIPVNYEEYKFMKRDEVKGVFISDLGQIDFKWAWIEEPYQEAPVF